MREKTGLCTGIAGDSCIHPQSNPPEFCTYIWWLHLFCIHSSKTTSKEAREQRKDMEGYIMGVPWSTTSCWVSTAHIPECFGGQQCHVRRGRDSQGKVRMLQGSKPPWDPCEPVVAVAAVAGLTTCCDLLLRSENPRHRGDPFPVAIRGWDSKSKSAQ